MAVYIFLYVGIFVFFVLQKSTLKMFKDNKLNISMMFLIVLIIVGLRNSAMGNDLPGYITSFQLCGELSLNEMIILRGDTFEIGYIIFMKILSFFSLNENFFLFVNTLVSIFPIVYVLKKENIDGFYATISYVSLPSFLMLYSGLRQSIAMAICFCSILFLKEKKKIKFLLTVLVATLFHSSAIVFLLTYPAFYLKVIKKHRIYTLVLLGIIFLLREQLFVFLMPLIGEVYGQVVRSNSFGILLFLILNYVIAIFFSEENEIESNGYMNILFLGIVCQVFASVNHMAMRLSEYFIFILVLLIPKIVFKKRKNRFNSIVLASGYIVMLVFMGLLFIYQGKDSWAESYPYFWFWQDYVG